MNTAAQWILGNKFHTHFPKEQPPCGGTIAFLLLTRFVFDAYDGAHTLPEDRVR